jgi:hypothetical protein
MVTNFEVELDYLDQEIDSDDQIKAQLLENRRFLKMALDLQRVLHVRWLAPSLGSLKPLLPKPASEPSGALRLRYLPLRARLHLDLQDIQKSPPSDPSTLLT